MMGQQTGDQSQLFYLFNRDLPKPGHAQFDARSGRETAVQFEGEE